MSLAYLLLLAILLNLAGFILAYWRKSDKLTDFSYGASFIVLSAAAITTNEYSKTKLLALIIICLWGARLATFLLIRIIKNKKDRRFDGVRENFWKFGAFWLGQGILVWVLLLPALFLFGNNETAHGIKACLIAGTIVALAGLATETVADLQKFRFSQNPDNKNRWIDSGLWKYSRHPNYFGEILVWLGVYIYCFGYVSSVQRALGVISPVAITFMLLFVTGLPRLERYADEKWGSNKEYKRYKAGTSVLVPLPKKQAY